MKIKRIIHLLLTNFLILLIGCIVIELFMGGWLNKDNQLTNISVLRNCDIVYDCNLYTYSNIRIHYSRDKFGLRGTTSFNYPQKIDILTVGGSTTEQEYITDGETWQDVLEENFKNEQKNVVISNAGVNGRSTYGHLRDFEIWFPKIPDLRPKYILFYVGINDFFTVSDTSSYDVLIDYNNSNSSSKIGRIIWKIRNFPNSIKINSVFYNFYRKMIGWKKAKAYKVQHAKINFLKMRYVRNGIAKKELYELFDTHLSGFEKRLKKLIEYTKAMGAEPIFVTQPSLYYRINSDGSIIGNANKGEINGFSFNGVDYYYLYKKLNNTIKKVCSNNYQIVELTELPIWNENDFYDYVHNTPTGAKKVGEKMFKELKNLNFD